MDNACDDYKFIADRMKDLGYRAYTGLTPPDPDKPKAAPRPMGATGASGAAPATHTEFDGWC